MSTVAYTKCDICGREEQADMAQMMMPVVLAPPGTPVTESPNVLFDVCGTCINDLQRVIVNLRNEKGYQQWPPSS